MMLPSNTTMCDDNSRLQRSSLACESCKRRKAKCDRGIPSCLLCRKISQNCVYPTQRLRPGPKIGSSRRKRQNLDPVTFENLTAQNQGPSHITQDLSLSEPERIEPVEIETPGSSPIDIVAANFIKAISLTSLIHPDHESRTASLSALPASPEGTQSPITEACHSIGISKEDLHELTDVYFDNRTAFSLFHQPSFGTKIQSVSNVLHLKALFASIAAFAVRFMTTTSSSSHSSSPFSSNQSQSSPAESCDLGKHWEFVKLAMNAIDESLAECDDEIPPLILLQAMVLTTYHQLIRGVRGRAWRLLGQCVRIAYEQKLHLIDFEAHRDPSEVDVRRWSANEEKRRCWWALWEMDIFASTVRRSPTAIDWSMSQTYLPIDDELWFANKYQASCFFEEDLMDRWRKLKESRNESPVAWTIVLNSLMREAQVLVRGNLSGTLVNTDHDDHVSALLQYFHNAFCKKRSSDDAKQQAILESLHCTVAALPEHLAYRGECLDFATNRRAFSNADPATIKHVRHLHASKYTIYLTIQLARFMIYHHSSFEEVLSGTTFIDTPRDDGLGPELGWTAGASLDSFTCRGLSNCVEAADNVLEIVKNSVHCHVQWVTPFLSSILWIATAMQILRKVFEPGSHFSLAESNSEVLRLTCAKYSQFWGTPLALMDNLDALEGRLEEQRMGVAVAACKERRESRSPRHGQTQDATASDCTATNRLQFRQPISTPRMGELPPHLSSSVAVDPSLGAANPIQEVDWMNTTVHPEAFLNWFPGSLPESDNPEVYGVG